MDRPEDVQPHPTNGKVYIMLTNNDRRRPEQADKANPRPENEFGHIIEMTAPDGDHAAATFRWDMLIKCGDPRVAEVGALWNPAHQRRRLVRLARQLRLRRRRAGCGSPPTRARPGPGRSTPTASTPSGPRASSAGSPSCSSACRWAPRCAARASRPTARRCSWPCSIRPPTACKDWKPFGRESTFEDPATRWPDFKPDMPPRPSVVAIRKKGGGKIAT